MDGFVRPRFRDGTFESPLPLGEHFVALLSDPRPLQLAIEGPRGSGLTTTLKWLARITAETQEGSGRCFSVARAADLAEAALTGTLDRIRQGEALAFLDLSVTSDLAAVRRVTLDQVAGPRAWVVLAGTELDLCALRRLFPRLERVTLAPWGADELLELLSSSPRYAARRAQLVATLPGVCGDALRRPRTARWLLDAAIRLPEDVSPTRSRLYASFLDTLEEDDIRALRAPFVEWTRPPRETLLSLFEVSPGKSALIRSGVLTGRARHPKLALAGLRDFLAAGDALEAIARGDIPGRVERAWFQFLREMISSAHRAVLGARLEDPQGPTTRDGIAATILSVAGEQPCLDGRRARDLSHANLEGADLPQARLANGWVVDAVLSSVRLEGIDATNALFEGVDLRGASAERAVFSAAALHEVDASGARLAGASFIDATLARSSFASANLEGADLARARIVRTRFEKACLKGVSLEGASLEGGVTLRDADLTGANLSRASLHSLDLRSTLLGYTRWEGAQVFACGLARVGLDGVEASGAKLEECDLSDATFRAARLEGADFLRCNAHGASFDGAFLRNARFTLVDFQAGSSRAGLLLGKPPLEGNKTGYYVEGTKDEAWSEPGSTAQASFRGADLHGVDFFGTGLFRVDFRGALMDAALRERAKREGAILGD